MKLVDEILKGLLPEDEEKTVAIYAGGFKPPTKGHFQVIKQALEEHPDIDELLIYIGKKERGGITQAQSLLVWEIYANYLPLKVELIPTSTPPIKAVYNYAKNNPETNVLWIIGAREGDEEDFGDIASRTKAINNYPNIALAVTVTTTGASGTAARNAANISIEKLTPLLPSVISDKEAVEVYNIITNNLNENLNEGPQFGVLYHFTQYLSDVLDDNILRGPISLTRSLDSYAAEWLGDQPYFILDKDKLRTKYKIRPYKDTSDNPDYEEISQYDEMEEVIDTDVTNLSKYIIKVVLPEPDEEYEDALKEKDIPYEIGKPLNEKKKTKDYFGLNKLIREIVEEPKYKIFSDMDGVLTDFDASFKKASDGIAPRDYEKKFGKDKFWELIDGGGVGYWVGMPYMPDGETYWNYIKDYDVELLSSPSRSNTSRLGKRLWVRNNMPGVKLTLAQAYLKKNYAAPNHILIDDRKSNIDEWRAEGGIGILHTSAADTIQQLKKLGL